MTYYKHCINQQILNWHFNSICRYSVVQNIPVNQSLSNSRFVALTEQIEQKECKNTILNKEEKAGKNTHNEISKAYFNHPKHWAKIETITLHATSKRLLLSSELYTAFYKCFCCCGQSPRIIKGKKAIAAFRVIKGAIIGTQSTLRNKSACFFLYKWAFLAAELPISRLKIALKGASIAHEQNTVTKRKDTLSKQGCIGINNVFVFPELDKLDYNLFKTVPGFDLIINYKPGKK